MQIYYTDQDPRKCAENLPDGLLSKILLEVTQIACTVSNENGVETPYRSTHKNHPFVKWAAESKSNWLWLKLYGAELVEVWRKAYGHSHYHQHKSGVVLGNLAVPPGLPDEEFTEPPIVFLEEFPGWGNALNAETIEAYREYLAWKVNRWRAAKQCSRLYSWTGRERPDFIEFWED